jgi:malonate transporter
MLFVLSSLAPVVLLIAIGFWVGVRGWVSSDGAKEISNLAFMVLAPALLFRTMSQVHLDQLDVQPVAMYFVGAIGLFAVLFLSLGWNRRATVLALAATFSNTVMLGIPLIGLIYGPPGLVYLFTLISLHALVMLTLATVVLELVLAREAAMDVTVDAANRHPVMTIALAVRNAVIHPVPMPILLGLAWGQLGWVMPEVLDKPMQWMSNAFGPLALLLVGITLAGVLHDVRQSWAGQSRSQAMRPLWVATSLALLKNLGHPLLVLCMGWMFGVTGLALAVMVSAASMPIGANVFLFSQRYAVGQDVVPTAVALSTLLAVVTVPWVLSWVH